VKTVRRWVKLTIKAIFGHRLADLWRSPEEELTAFVAQIKADMSRLPDRLAEKKELFACFNTDGNKPPIFWCFNHWTEAVFLAYHLGSDRPLYAMHSLCDITQEEAKKSMHTKRLAEIYGDLLCDLYPDGPVLLGGNCQATCISEAMAHYLLAKRGQTPMLISLESQPFYSYPGNLLMLFGDHDKSRFNPFISQKSPIPSWQNKHQHVTWGVIKGSHGEYFQEPNVHQLCWYITQCADKFLHGIQFPTGQMTPNNQPDTLNSNITEKLNISQ